jgi:hypothetical protein
MQRVQTRARVGFPATVILIAWRFGFCHFRDLRFEWLMLCAA